MLVCVCCGISSITLQSRRSVKCKLVEIELVPSREHRAFPFSFVVLISRKLKYWHHFYLKVKPLNTMARSGLTLVIVIIAIILAISFQQGKIIWSSYYYYFLSISSFFNDQNISFNFVFKAFALKCWHCDSALNPSCGYPFEEKKLNKTLLVDCTPIGGDPVCLKIVSKYNFWDSTM